LGSARTYRMIRGNGKKWLTVKGMAEYCLVSRGTVRRWIKEGKIASIKLPSGHYRVSIGDFRDFLERYEIPVREELFKSKSKRKEVT